MRSALVESLEKILKENEEAILLTADLGFMAFEGIMSKYPKQFCNVGVSEANMIGLAGGLAKTGRKVFCYSMSPFVTLRCLEQIKTHLGIGKQNICLIGVGAGYAYGHQGSSHHSIEDFGVMRSMPGVSIYSPSDANEAKLALEFAGNSDEPSYIRLSFCKDARVTPPELYKGNSIVRIASNKQEGLPKVGFFCAGVDLLSAIESVKHDFFNKYSYEIYSMFKFDNQTAKELTELLPGLDYIVTTETNVLSGGSGELINSTIALNGQKSKIINFCLPETHYRSSGSEQHFLELAKLTPSQMTERLISELSL